ncbi:MAG: ribosome-associated protein [Candidatus Aldehydirespiratoraceae bacterium]|jgi:ribosome-associated protein
MSGAREGGEDDRLVVTDAVRIPRFELLESFSASGGPGGQHANKTATRVELTFQVATSSAFRHESQRERVMERLGSVVRVVADDERSQLRNRRLAEQRLADKLRSALHVERKRRATKPTRGSQRRRLDGKSRRSEVKQQRRRPNSDD